MREQQALEITKRDEELSKMRKTVDDHVQQVTSLRDEFSKKREEMEKKFVDMENSMTSSADLCKNNQQLQKEVDVKTEVIESLQQSVDLKVC